MNDLISRQTMLEGLARIAKGKAKSDAQKSLMGRVMFFTEQLPSAQPEHTETHSCDCERTETHDWIPVSEALPEDGVTVWVTIQGHDVIRCKEGETLEQAVARIGKIRWVTQGYWSEEEHGWNDPSFGCPLMVQPIAWMPINRPEPWRGGQND